MIEVAASRTMMIALKLNGLPQVREDVHRMRRCGVVVLEPLKGTVTWVHQMGGVTKGDTQFVTF
jgi:hypothetical protein